MGSNEIRIKPVKEENFAALRVEPAKAVPGWLLILHGYGGCKEEMLPLSVFMAARGIPALAIDLPGHGETGGLFDYKTTIGCLSYWQNYLGREIVAAVGHSVGGRLALASPFSRNVAISPPLSAFFVGNKREMIRLLRPKQVKESAPFSGLREILDTLGKTLPADPGKKGLLLFAQQDLPVVKEAAAAASPRCYEIKEIKHCHHQDILTAPQTLEVVWSWLRAKVIDGRSVFPL